MNDKSARYLPLIVTVGQVVIFPYYIIWLKDVSMTFTLFAWFFAAFSFAAAFGYRMFQSKKNKVHSYIYLMYICMGCVYLFIGSIKSSFESLPYIVLLLQVSLGFLQGYFRAWHTEQDTYHLHAVHHYLLVGFMMIGFSFIKIISPGIFITIFGLVLILCGVWEIIRNRKFRSKVIH